MRRSSVPVIAAALVAGGLSPSPAPAQGAAPSQLVYSTYFGGAEAEETAAEVEVDPAGNVYLTGGTNSDDYPFTDVAPNERDPSWAVAPVTKLSDGGDIVYSTFVGDATFAQGLAVDAAGYAYVTGSAYRQLATTAGVFDPTFNGEEDAFVAKLDPDGNVVWLTYLGGDLPDSGTDVEIDASGDVYVTGYTFSDSFPVTEGAYETERPGSYDVFVAKLTSDGSDLVFATYLGGASSERAAEPTGDPTLDVDGTGAVYVAGTASSRDFPTTSLVRGYPRRSNAFVSKVSADGSDLEFSTVIGGESGDRASDVEVDAAGRIYLVGNTRSDGFPITDGAVDTTMEGYDRWDDEGFVVRLNADGTLDYSTFLGGRGGEELSAIELLDDGSAYVTGSGSIGYPVTPDAFDPFPPASDRASKSARIDPAEDVVLTRLNATGTELVYSTFLGGTGIELARDLETAGEEVVVAGHSMSNNLPTTVDAVRPSADERTPHNMFVSKLRPGVAEPCTNHGHDGDDTVTGTRANDLLCGFGGADVLEGLGGNDVLYGGAGTDELSGDAGYDFVLAGAGDDSVRGGPGADALFGEAGGDAVAAGDGDDRAFIGGREDQVVDGGPGDDVLSGGGFFDLLLGRAGDDKLLGRAGPDRLNGGLDDDRLLGGRGRDRCESGSGRDRTRSCEG